jgi:hypothetical protein
MNGTNRSANRILLSLFGLIFMGVGGFLVALAAVPAVGSWWQGWAKPFNDDLVQLAARTQLGSGGSWIWIVVAAALLALVICMVSWISNQGKGRASTLASYAGNVDDDGAAGAVSISCAVAEQALKTALMERPDLLSVSVTSFDFRGQTGIKVRVFPRQGVAPHAVARHISGLVESLDQLLGLQTPVLVSIGSGARARFTKAERVR